MTVEDDLSERLIQAHHVTMRLTEKSVSDALLGFPLTPIYGMGWLARAVQGVLFLSENGLSDAISSPEDCGNTDDDFPESNTDTRVILGALAQDAQELWSSLFHRYWAVESLIGRGISDRTKFADAMAGIEWLAGELGIAAANWPKDRPRWRNARDRGARIRRAEYLAPVFEIAFGKEATINSWPGSDGGPWPDFYLRIARLAFDEINTPDRMAILKLARKSALAWNAKFGSDIRMTFPPGTLPEYPI